MSRPNQQTGQVDDPPESLLIRPASWTQQLDPASFSNPDRPLEVDVGCGKGRFLMARSAAHSETDFLGIDRLLRRLRKIDRKLQRRGSTNVRLLRIEALYAIEHLLPPLCVTTFYVFFPDPWPKRRHHRRRLFSNTFLDALYRILLPAGRIHVATDNGDYFEQIRGVFAGDERFEEEPAFVPSDQERSDFELIFLAQGGNIGRIVNVSLC